MSHTQTALEATTKGQVGARLFISNALHYVLVFTLRNMAVAGHKRVLPPDRMCPKYCFFMFFFAQHIIFTIYIFFLEITSIRQLSSLQLLGLPHYSTVRMLNYVSLLFNPYKIKARIWDRQRTNNRVHKDVSFGAARSLPPRVFLLCDGPSGTFTIIMVVLHTLKVTSQVGYHQLSSAHDASQPIVNGVCAQWGQAGC